MNEINRRVALKTIAGVGATLTIPFPNGTAGISSTLRKPIRLGVIADLHGGLL